MHALAVAWVASMLVAARTAPERYEGILQEDHFIEWWTVTLFAASGLFALRLAWEEGRVFDALVGAFCLFVAGEEFSWGQRLLGLTPPVAFLENNRQQELTLHNFAAVFGEPKWVLMAALVGFGLLVPAVAASQRGRRLVGRLGATVASLGAAAWLLASTSLLAWYPVDFTGEWVEALAGGLFLVVYAPSPRSAAVAAGTGTVLAAGLAVVSGLGFGATEAELACARSETEAIATDLAYGAGSTGRLAGAASLHKRVFTAADEGYVYGDGLEAFAEVQCADDPRGASRREHAIDPWGTAYWVQVQRSAGEIHLVVYSFGPNRRRDGSPGHGAGDDIAATVVITL